MNPPGARWMFHMCFQTDHWEFVADLDPPGARRTFWSWNEFHKRVSGTLTRRAIAVHVLHSMLHKLPTPGR